MTTITRNLSQIDGANVPAPTQNGFTTTGWEVFANDAAYEAAFGSPPDQGATYFNSTELLLRTYNGIEWVYLQNGINAIEDSASTGTDQDIDPTYHNFVLLTNASLSTVRSLNPAQTKIVYLCNDTGSDINLLHESAGAVAEERLILPGAVSLTLSDGDTANFVYDSISQRFRFTNIAGSGGGDGGEGGVNFFVNGNFNDLVTTGWLSGGGFSAFSLETVSPLEGAASGKITVTGILGTVEALINTPDTAYGNQPILFKRSLLLTGTGSYVTYIYNVTQGQQVPNTEVTVQALAGGNLISPWGQDVVLNSSDTFVWRLEDQGAGVVSDEIIFDLFSLDPNGGGIGNFSKDFESYTPVITGNGSGLSSSTLNSAEWSLNGKSMTISFNIAAINVPDASITEVYIPLPTGYTVRDGSWVIGSIYAFDSPSVVVGTVEAKASESGTSLIAKPSTGNWSNPSEAKGELTFGVNEGGSAMTGNDLLTNNAKGSFNTSAGQSIPNSTWTSVTFGTTIRDELSGQFDGTVFTATKSCWIEGAFSALWSNAFNQASFARVLVNGANARNGIQFPANSASSRSHTVPFLDIYLEEGDTAEFQLFQTEGAARTLQANAEFNWLNINVKPKYSTSLTTFPLSTAANETEQYLVPLIQESGEGDLGTIGSWGSPGSKKYRWIKTANKVDFWWYITSDGGSASSSITASSFLVPSEVPTWENHFSTNNDFAIPISGATNSNDYIKQYSSITGSDLQINVALASNTALSYWVGHATWMVTSAP